jgi:hypothetical protein
MAIQDIDVGSVPNDGTGDSIRDAFVKANDNFLFLDLARQNLTTGNLIATGNVSLRASTASYWTGGPYYIDGVEIATVGTTFSGGTVANPTTFQATTPSSSNVTGAVVVTGGLGVGGSAYLSAAFAKALTVEGSLTAATLQVGGVVQLDAAVATGNLTTTGFNNTSGNVTAGSAANPALKRSVISYFGAFSEVTGTLQTAAQPNITSTGTLSALATSGNLVANNVTANVNLQALTLSVSANAKVTANLLVGTYANVGGNVISRHVESGIGTFANVTVSSIPTVKSVTTKEYVTATVVGFAIGLGS